jgi:hypothetical protein
VKGWTLLPRQQRLNRGVSLLEKGIPELQESISAWQRAKNDLKLGLSVEEMIKLELERVHGAGTVVCVNVMASQDVSLRMIASAPETSAGCREGRGVSSSGAEPPRPPSTQFSRFCGPSFQGTQRRRRRSRGSLSSIPAPSAGANSGFRSKRREAVPLHLSLPRSPSPESSPQSDAVLRRSGLFGALQIFVYGPMYGAWGTEKFGNQPKFVDSLKFHCMRLEAMYEKLKERRLETEVLVEPTAFVTFK